MSKRPFQNISLLDLYIFVTSVIGAYLLVNAAIHAHYITYWKELLVLGTLGAVSSSVKVVLPSSKGTISIAYAFVFTSMLLLGTEETILIAAVCAFTGYAVQVREFRTHQLAFNVGNLVVCVMVACFAIRILNSDVTWFRNSFQILPIITATSIYFILNSFMVGLVISLSESKGFRRIWLENFYWTAPVFMWGHPLLGH